jgi:hypothetical protein
VETSDNSYTFSHSTYCLRATESNETIVEYCTDDDPYPWLATIHFYCKYCLTLSIALLYRIFFFPVMIVSIPFLIATFLVYALIPELQTLNGKCLMFYVGGMIVYSIILPVVNLAEPTDHCELLGYISYFAIMVSFFWVNVMCFDMWSKFGGIRMAMANEQTMQFFYYICYGIGGPLIMVTIVAIVETTGWDSLKAKIGQYGQCFIEGKGHFLNSIYNLFAVF